MPTPSPDRAGLPGLHDAVATFYHSDDDESRRIRGAHLNAVVRLTPQTMIANAGSAVVVVCSFYPRVTQGMWLWLAALLTVCAVASAAWWRRRGHPIETASSRTLQRATVNAMVLAGIWAVMPAVWFGDASSGQQMVIATLLTGMIGAGGFVLSPLPHASIAYVTICTAAALVALWRAGDPTLINVALLLVLYSPTVGVGALAAWGKATALIRAQLRSEHHERMLSVLLQDFEQNADEALWETGVDGHLRHLSPRLGELLGLSVDDIREQSFLKLVSNRSPDGAVSLRQAMDVGRPFKELQLSMTDARGTVHLAFNGKPLVDEAGQTIGWRGVLADVTDKVDGDRLLRQLAHTDSLTGLANRFMLRDTLAQAVGRGEHIAMLAIDLDHFKAVNDRHGHSAGDEVLKAVAVRLRACVRPGDLVSRLGGDEFAILLRQSSAAHDASAMARRVIGALTEPIPSRSRMLRIGASVGVAICDGSEVGVDEVLVQADMALYAAKESGRGRHEIYATALGDMSRRRLAIEQGLRVALERGELAMHWQPKVDIGTWQVTGAEALMRWTHPELGRVMPTEFIVVAEQSGLIDELGRWALNEACEAAVDTLWGMTVSVNVSARQLREASFVSDVRDALRRTGLEPARLELEITESIFIEDADGALEKLHALRGLGVRVALDDFGTGYSSLSYLRRFPFDTLKIDRGFVKEVLLRRDARAIVQMISNLAVTLGMRTVCEGVETAEQLRAVSEAGCHEVQGYLVSAPRPLDEIALLRREWRHEAPRVGVLH
jgi:diguanylate cyclase (GGDEF)-like protein/PAS domain S-box-containing protein